MLLHHGNEGFGGHHYEGIIHTSETSDIYFTLISGLPSIFITLWKDFSDDFETTLISPTGEFIDFLTSGPVPYNEEQEKFVILNNPSAGIWRIRIRGINVVNGRFNIWLPTVEEVTRDTSFRTPNIYTTLTLPSTSKRVITVGAYNSRINSVADFSGRGYTRSNVYIKPDLVAPGIGIITTKRGGGYDGYTGTSFSAPFVTGAASLMLEWGIVNRNDRFLYAQRLKAFLRKGAKRETNIAYPNPTWGYGFLCINNTLDLL